MKNIVSSLCLAILLTGCMTPAEHIARKNYDAAVRTVAKKLDGKHQKTKYLKTLEISFLAANEQDLQAIDNLSGQRDLISLEQTYEHYNRIHQRQKIVEPLLPLASRDGFRPNVRLIPVEEKVVESYSDMITEHRRTVREKLDLARNGVKREARQAFSQLDHFQKKHGWQEQALKDSAFALGQVFFFVQYESKSLADDAYQVVRSLEQDILSSPSPWIEVSQNRRSMSAPDYEVRMQVTDTYVSSETTNTTCTSITEQVQTGEKVVTDSTGKVVSREPVYETVTRTEYTTTYSKNARVKVDLIIWNNFTGQTELMIELNDDYDCSNSSSCCPSDSYMLNRCADGLNRQMLRKLKELIDD